MWPWCVGTFKGVEFLFSFGELINVLDFDFHFGEQLHHVPLLAKESQNNMKRRCDFFFLSEKQCQFQEGVEKYLNYVPQYVEKRNE